MSVNDFKAAELTINLLQAIAPGFRLVGANGTISDPEKAAEFDAKYLAKLYKDVHAAITTTAK